MPKILRPQDKHGKKNKYNFKEICDDSVALGYKMSKKLIS